MMSLLWRIYPVMKAIRILCIMIKPVVKANVCMFAVTRVNYTFSAIITL